MAINFVQPGEVMDWDNTSGALIKSSSAVLIGKRPGVALADIPVGRRGSVQMSGVFSLPKISGDAVTAGVQLYWKADGSGLTTTASGNTAAGYAFAPAAADAVTVNIKLNG